MSQLLSDKTIKPFSWETSILIIVSKIVLSWANSSIRNSHLSNITMIDLFFLIQSLFFLLVIANTTIQLASYPSILHELLTCYPFQSGLFPFSFVLPVHVYFCYCSTELFLTKVLWVRHYYSIIVFSRGICFPIALSGDE